MNKSETGPLENGTNKTETHILSTLEPFRKLGIHLRNNEITVVERLLTINFTSIAF